MKKTLRDCLLMSSLLMSPGLGTANHSPGADTGNRHQHEEREPRQAFKRLEKATKYKVLYASQDVEGLTVSRNIKASNVT